jgi:hypothetical protein
LSLHAEGLKQKINFDINAIFWGKQTDIMQHVQKIQQLPFMLKYIQ